MKTKIILSILLIAITLTIIFGMVYAMYLGILLKGLFHPLTIGMIFCFIYAIIQGWKVFEENSK